MSEKKKYKFTMPLKLSLTDRTRVCKTATKKHKVGDIIYPKQYYINFNTYNTWQFHLRNSIKQLYSRVVREQLIGITMSTPIKLTFIHYKHDHRKSDRANVCSIHEKFFCDALTTARCIPDDNDKYILETRYLSGGIDKGRGRVEIIVEEV